MAASLASPALAQKVHLATSMGDIVIELDAKKAPKSVENFLQYVKAGHYNGTVFHRVIPNFMIQGGGMLPDMKEKPTRPPIPLESSNGLSNTRGTVAMARTAVPDSATAQFFINVKDNGFLDQANSRDGNGYAVFDAALREVNDSQFGLQAGVFTRDVYRAQRAWDELHVGGVVIGDVPSWRVDHMPYGGVKNSGLGREGVRWAMEDMTEPRLLILRTPPGAAP